MSKASVQRKNARKKRLARLCASNPSKFDDEWQKRISSWLERIRRDAGKWKISDDRVVPSVFDCVDEALEILNECGTDAYKQYADQTFDLLTTECCRRVARRLDRRLFKTGARLNPN